MSRKKHNTGKSRPATKPAPAVLTPISRDTTREAATSLKRRDSPTLKYLRSLTQGYEWRRCDHYFPAIDGREELETLIKLRAKAEVSKEARNKLEKFIRDTMARAEASLRKALGLRLGRPRDHRKEGIWEWAAMLRQQDLKKWSWDKLAKELDSDYKTNPSAARERMRKGVPTCLERQKQPK